MSSNWYVAAVQRGKESALAVSLARYGVQVFSPEILVIKRGRKLREPLFPSYVFCAIGAARETWPQIRWARGIRYFLGSEAQPTPVDPNLVEAIKDRVRHWNEEGWISAFHQGERVRITSGPLSGLDALFSRYLPDRQRCEVLISLIGRDHTVQIPAVCVETASPAHMLA